MPRPAGVLGGHPLHLGRRTTLLTWAIASRGRTGGFRFQLLPGTAAFDDPRDISCSAHGCTLVGGKRSNDGRGDQFDIGTTLAWRGTGTSFAPQTTPPPPRQRRAEGPADPGLMLLAGTGASG